MYEVDNFIKESQRKTPLGNCECRSILWLTETVVMMRVARKDYTFADGTRIPQETTVSVNPTQVHHDPETYENPEQFEGFRLAKMRLQQDSKEYDIVPTSPKFSPSGYGRHACPGRYFAACKLKIMLAHTVLNYEVKMEGVRPPDVWLGSLCIPNPKGKVMFCKRAM